MALFEQGLATQVQTHQVETHARLRREAQHEFQLLMQRFQLESDSQSLHVKSLTNELQLVRAGWEAAAANAEASVAMHECALASARSEISAGTETTMSVHVARIASLERALVDARAEVVRAQAAVGRDEGGEFAHEEYMLQARRKETEMSSVLLGWEERWHDASARAESSAAAREAIDDSARQALMNQRLEFQTLVS